MKNDGFPKLRSKITVEFYFKEILNGVNSHPTA